MNIGFISVRFGGLDGVSLETDKWVQVLKRLGHKIHFCTGEIMDKQGYSMLTGKTYSEIKNAKIVPRMKIKSKDNAKINRMRYSSRETFVKNLIEVEARYIKDELTKWVEDKKIDLLISENSSAFPIHIPLGVAIARLVMGEDIPAILHHHDFGWERKKFRGVNKVIKDYIKYYFPFKYRRVQHVVINKIAQAELEKKYKVKSVVVPNIFPYKARHRTRDNFNKHFKKDFKLDKRNTLIALAPVRVVPRKDLRTAIKIVAKLDKKLEKHVVLVITGYTSDVGKPHERNLKRLAERLECDVRFIGDRIKARRYKERGKRYYSIFDTYPYADFIVYPSTWEGWGNAFGEAIAFKKFIVVRRFPVYVTDIQPLGFKTISFNKYCKNVINRIILALNNPKEVRKAVKQNLEIAKKKLDYSVLEEELKIMIDKLMKKHFFRSTLLKDLFFKT